MPKLTKLVTHPLGLAGYALACVFAYLEFSKQGPPWFVILAGALAAVCVVGGIALAWKTAKAAKPAPQMPSQPSVRQETRGDQSPAISKVEGPVKIEYK